MPNYEHLQSLFTGGEASPRLFGRVETDLYKKALAYCLNFEPLPQGGLLLAPGTQLVAPLVNASVQSRAIPFKVAGEQDYILELDDQALRIFKDDASAGAGTGSQQLIEHTELLANGNFLAAGTDWAVGGDGEVAFYAPGATTPDANAAGGKACVALTTNSYGSPGCSLAQSVTLTEPSTLQLRFAFQARISGSITLPRLPNFPIAVRVGTAPGLGDVMAWSGSGLTWGSPELTSHFFSNPIVVNRGAKVPAGTYHVTISIGSFIVNSAGNVLRAYFADLSLSAAGELDKFTTPWTAAELRQVQWAHDTGNNRMVFAHPNHPPQLLTYGGAPDSWTFAPCPFANAPSTWVTGGDDGTHVDSAHGNWSLLLNIPANPSLAGVWSGSKWPGAVAIFQGRLYLALASNLWASRPGNIFDFTPMDMVDGTPTITADNCFFLPLVTDGQIKWLRGRRALVIGTDIGEYSLQTQPGAGYAIDVQVAPESGYGSQDVQPADLGDQLVYVSRDSRKIRGINYQLSEAAWLSHDLTFTADHITQGLVKEVHYARDPDCSIVALLQDGTLAMCTYDRGGSGLAIWYDRREPVIAWWRRTTQGSIVSAAVSNGPSGSIVYLIVQRATGFFLEKMPMSELYPNRAYLDASVTLPVPAGDAPVIAGLSHLEGQTVRVLLDGALEDDQVVAGGQVTLSRAGTTVTIGLALPLPTAKTLPPEGGNPRGTSQRARRKWVKCALRLNRSALPCVNGVQLAPDRSPATPQDTPEPIVSGDFLTEVTGWDQQGQLTITQPLPLRTELLAVFGSIQVNEL